ncbi:MAG: hypothetical protein ACRD1S_16080 [Vicinamibacterales bacterium]
MPRRSFASLVAVFGAAMFFACSGQPPLAPTVPPAALGSGLSVDGMLASSPAGPEYADVSNQGGGGVYAANGATLVRQPNGLRVSISVPTPQPGTYNYPAGRTPGHPEVFTLWVFIFNFPDLCSDPCGADDLGVATAAKGGVYNGGGHAASGSHLTIAGRIRAGETPFNHAPLESPGTAEVHLAIAPHGALDPSALPEDFRLPTGPAVFWWVAIFD